jgi:hypothetical protein
VDITRVEYRNVMLVREWAGLIYWLQFSQFFFEAGSATHKEDCAKGQSGAGQRINEMMASHGQRRNDHRSIQEQTGMTSQRVSRSG